jgi:hypothetical protein
MSARFEIPFPPLRQPEPGARMEPPSVRIDPHWEYKTIERKGGEGLPSEAELNVLGAEHWELTGVASAGERVTFYFKRERST